MVLRGAVFSGFVLFLVCLCAYFARETGHKAHWLRTGCGILVALGFTVFALINGHRDFKNSDIFDLPILEGLLVVITVFGLMLVFRGFENRQFQLKRYPLVVLFLPAWPMADGCGRRLFMTRRSLARSQSCSERAPRRSRGRSTLCRYRAAAQATFPRYGRFFKMVRQSSVAAAHLSRCTLSWIVHV